MDRPLQTPSGESVKEIQLLPGERIVFRVSDIVAVLQNDVWRLGIFYLTNFQLHFKLTSGPEIQAPLMSIESVKKNTLTPEYHELKIRFKDFRMLKFTIQGKEIDVISSYLTKWQNIESLNQLFAFEFKCPVSRDLNGWNLYDSVQEYERMGIPNSQWRISNVNAEYLLCDTYPQYLVIPAKISGQELMTAASFRAGGRIPVLVWKHPTKSTTISRCSQPLTGLTGNRCVQDEKLVGLIASSSPSQKLYIVDARPKKNAVANQMKGGGYENTLHYDKCQVTWASIPNIHVMYDSWLKLFRLLNKSSPDDSHWYSTLEATGWMTHVKTILESVVNIVDLVDQENSVLLHCSDGWDRTPTLTSLAEICLDPYYRTLKGFLVLIEKDWLAFGHRYGDRCGHKESGEKSKQLLPKAHKKQQKPTQQTPTLFSPIFMFFLDCVYQLINQFPFAFEFNSNCLKALLDALYSCQYGTFLCNSDKERKQKMFNKTVSLWTIINANTKPYLNPFYQKNDQTLHPSCRMKHLVFWDDFYLRGWPGLQDHAFAATRKTVFERSCTFVVERDLKIAQLEAELEKMKATQQSLMQSVASYKYQLGSIYSMVNQNLLGNHAPSDATGSRKQSLAPPPVAEVTPQKIVREIINDMIEEVYIQVHSKKHEHALCAEDLGGGVANGHRHPARALSDNSVHDTYVQLKERRNTSADQSNTTEILNAGSNPRRRSASLGKKALEQQQQQNQEAQPPKTGREKFLSQIAAINDESNLIPHDDEVFNSAKFSSAPLPHQHRSKKKLFQENGEPNGSHHHHHHHHNSVPIPQNGSHKSNDEEEFGSFQPRRPPEWIQDHVVSSCRGCGSEFSTLRRRHHCRNCGHVFCRQCCFERRSIHQLGFVKPVRVCQNCTKVLDQPSSQFPTSPDKFSSLVFS